MKAITLIQPYASLIVDRRKRIETRSWPTRHQGKIAIHAGSRVDRKDCIRFGYDPEKVSRSAVLGTAYLVECVKFPNRKAPPDEYGNFRRGRYGFILKDVHRFARPVPVRGQLRLWHWRRKPPTPAEIRHNAAVKAWKTRRANMQAETRHNAAVKAWQTRRADVQAC